MYLLWISILFAYVVVGTVFCGSVVNGNVTNESGHTEAQTISVVQSSVHVNTDSFVDTTACYLAMEESMKHYSDTREHHGHGDIGDGNDRKMNFEEYLNFAMAYSNPNDGFSVNATYDQHNNISSILLEELQSTFNRLACLCTTNEKERNTKLLYSTNITTPTTVKQQTDHSPSYNNRSDQDNCCVGFNAGIDTTGSFVGETPTLSEESYLFQVCTQTSSTLHNHNHSNTTIPISTTAPSSTVVPTSETETEATTPTPTPTTTIPVGIRSIPSTTTTDPIHCRSLVLLLGPVKSPTLGIPILNKVSSIIMNSKELYSI